MLHEAVVESPSGVVGVLLLGQRYHAFVMGTPNCIWTRLRFNSFALPVTIYLSATRQITGAILSILTLMLRVNTNNISSHVKTLTHMCGVCRLRVKLNS